MSEPSWLTEVRLRAQRRMLWCRALWLGHHYAEEQSLAITHSEVERALTPLPELLAAERAFYASDEAASALSHRLQQLEHGLGDPRWEQLTAAFGLCDAERALLACALAAEAQPSLRRVFGYLQDEVTALDATPAIAAALWSIPAAPAIGAWSPLVRWRLARPLQNGRAPDELESALMPWAADPLVLTHLLAGNGQPDVGGLTGELIPAPPAAALFARELDRIVSFVQALAPGSQSVTPLEIELLAPAGAGKATLAAQVAQRLGRELVAVDSGTIAAAPDPATAAVRELRGAHLCGAALHWRHAELLPDAARDALSAQAPLVFLGTEAPLRAPAASGVLRRTYPLAPLGRERRLVLWSALDSRPAPGPVADWALSPADVVAAAAAAPAGEEAIREVCKRRLLHAPSELITPLTLPFTWDDLIVPAQLRSHLREFEAQARARSEVLDGWGLGRLAPLGRGVSALFAGPSGTGKTMAAQVLARELGLELLRVDLAGVVNKYIGETEKHLRTVFAACERAPVMLFFDEADALFGRRMQVGDAHDRFANIEIDYLLTRMEEFDGVAVLATNRKGDIDTAFMRRLRFVVDFAPPTVTEREQLWRAALEAARDDAGRPVVERLDWPALARVLDLTGAGIKAAALAAAFLARTDGTAIQTRHIVAAARRELEKQGVIVRAGARELSANGNGGADPPSSGEIGRLLSGGVR